MALIKCPDCGSSISDSAPSCPQCGRPNAYVSPSNLSQSRRQVDKQRMSLFAKVLWILFALALAWLILYVFDGASYIGSLFESKDDIASQIKPMLQNTINENEALKNKGLQVEGINVLHTWGNNYQGFANVNYHGVIHVVPMDIINDDGNLGFKIAPGAFLFILQDTPQPTSTSTEQIAPPQSSLQNQTQQSAIPDLFDTNNYCRSIASAAGGSNDIELSCRRSEESAKLMIEAHRPIDRIMNYCRNIGSAAGGSYQVMRECIQQEESAQKQLGDS